MALLKILFLPDERLRQISTPVDCFDNDLQTLLDDMFETMYHAKGVGLAAPQIGVNKRISVVDVSSNKSENSSSLIRKYLKAKDKRSFKKAACQFLGQVKPWFVQALSKLKL